MDHVNNAVYLDWFEESVLGATSADGRLALAATPRTYRLEYAAAADSGTTITDAAWADQDGGWSYRLTGPDGTDLFRARLDPPGPRASSGGTT
jgi:acyl-ACP thioesterase